jgi:outer membrane receptor protein involved in Fe transport
MDVSAGEDSFKRFSLTGTAVSADKATRMIGAVQYDDRDQFDGDGNYVSENPSLENSSIFGKVTHDINDFNTIALRLALYRSEVYGGPLGFGKSETLDSYIPSTDSLPNELFTDGNVSDQFTGEPWETVEIVDTDRVEFSGSWISDLSENTWMVFTGAYAQHTQDSFYEGFDYYAEDKLYYVDTKLNHVLSDQHLLTIGVDYRDEEMRSRSRAVDLDPNLTSDSYNHSDLGLYIQDEWTPITALEVSMALRIDHIKVDFVDQDNGDVINKTLFAPRAHIRYSHNEHWTSRVSAGKGYRAPLSIFETDHGILEDGFNIAISDIEESWSTNYALSYESERFSTVVSIGRTKVENVASTDDSESILTLINSDETITATVFDIVAGYEITSELKFNGGFEYYDYSDSYKDTFAIAPIEMRIRAGLDYTSGPWQVSTNLTWVGSRDLSEYGYSDRYGVFNDANNNGTVEAGELQNPKGTHASSYFTADARVAYKLNNSISLYAGGSNLFNYTQTDEESPLFWDAEGNYDVVHIYAPLRGRVLYAGLKLAL